MRHIYDYNDHPLSEDMLLGIGGGVGFMYWQMKDAPPFIGGRGKSRPKDAFEICVGERTGVHIQDFTTSSLRKAEASMLSMLEVGQPVMLQVDMGYLPYFDFGGEEYHFGGHYIVACGYDPETKIVLVADRDDQLHTVPLDDLMKARSSRFQPFAPNNRWFSFDFSHKRAPTAEEVRQAITEQIEGMLNPPITNFGVKGIRKAAKRSLKWPEVLDEKTLRFTMFNTYIFIAPDGGTGGGIFRYMFSRFLKEAAQVTGETSLVDIAKDFKQIGGRWQEAAGLFHQGWEERNPNDILPETSRLMLEIADLEEAAWSALDAAIR
jgi:hypothetical protein